MAYQIKLTPSQVRMRANQYRTEAGKVGEVVIRMDNLLSMLRTEWEGSASESYEAKYMELRPCFQKARELIEEIAAALDSTANIVEETDGYIARQFSGGSF